QPTGDRRPRARPPHEPVQQQDRDARAAELGDGELDPVGGVHGTNLGRMAVVKINAIEVPEGAGSELEKRFANRLHAVDGQPGFLGFELLRPVAGEQRYFVVTRWESDDAFKAW